MTAWLLLAILGFSYTAPASDDPLPAAEDLLVWTIAHHDPQGVWDERAIELVADVTLSEALAEARGYHKRRDRLQFDRPAQRFRYNTYRGRDRVEIFRDKNGFSALLNRSAEVSDDDLDKHRLHENQLPVIHDYFYFVYGIPMKLRDPGTRLDPDVRRSNFAGQDVYVLRVTYNPEIGTDAWEFYIDVYTHALVGCRFYRDGLENEGEYIVYSDEIEADDGLRLPRMRQWFTNQDDEYIATDEVRLVKVSPSQASRSGTLPPSLRPLSAHATDPHRQFDFWIGEWDVNLRMFRDGEWADRIQARASIYSILGGKAILELWDSEPIKGFSLRHYDPARQKWVLWLNWPSPGRSGMSSLEGGFRHGRGDFFSESVNAEGETVTQRYSFNDISPDALRWDDANTTDGIEWRSNWIMEWSRRRDEPALPLAIGPTPTYVDGTRCSGERYRVLETIAGNWRSADRTATLTARKILDGCAVIGLAKVGDEETFWITTWDTGEERWEMGVLSDDRDAPLVRYTSSEDPWKLESVDGARQSFSVGEDVVWRREATGSRDASEVRFLRR